MFKRHRKALESNRIADLQATNERLERTAMGLRRELDLALCPISGIRQRAYQEGLTEGIRRGRTQVEQAQRQTYGTDPLRQHEHDFAELEHRVLANMLMRGDTYFGDGFVRRRWRSSYPQLQNLPRRQPPKLIALTIEYAGKPYSWKVGEGYVVGLQVRPAYKDTSKLQVIVHYKDGSYSTRTYDKKLFTQPTSYFWKEQA